MHLDLVFRFSKKFQIFAKLFHTWFFLVLLSSCSAILNSASTAGDLNKDSGAGLITNRAPVATGHLESFSEDTEPVITLSGSDADLDDLTYTVVSNPTHGSLGTIVGNSVTYTPAANYNGADSFTFTVSDGQLVSSVATVSLSITGVNDAPETSGQHVNVPYNTLTNVTFSATDTENDSLSYEIVQGPSNGLLGMIEGAEVAYSPNSTFSGSDQFTFRVSDGTSYSSTHNVTISVNSAGIRHLYLSTSGNDANDGSEALPFRNAQRAADAAIAANPTGPSPIFIHVGNSGSGDFGSITLSAPFGSNITWTGLGFDVSKIGVVNSRGTDSYVNEETVLVNATSGHDVILTSDGTVSFTTIDSRGGDNSIDGGFAAGSGQITLKGVSVLTASSYGGIDTISSTYAPGASISAVDTTVRNGWLNAGAPTTVTVTNSTVNGPIYAVTNDQASSIQITDSIVSGVVIMSAHDFEGPAGSMTLQRSTVTDQICGQAALNCATAVTLDSQSSIGGASLGAIAFRNIFGNPTNFIGSVNGNAEFYGTSFNSGSITGTGTFYDSSNYSIAPSGGVIWGPGNPNNVP
jgi:hypothetical protein